MIVPAIMIKPPDIFWYITHRAGLQSAYRFNIFKRSGNTNPIAIADHQVRESILNILKEPKLLISTALAYQKKASANKKVIC